MKRVKKMFEKFLNKYCWHILFFICFFSVVFVSHLKRGVYLYLYGKKYDGILQISQNDYFEDVDAASFTIKKGKDIYVLVPKTKYAVTGRVGIVDSYDTFFNRIYRGQFQGKYINLVPRDVFLLIGTMARDEIFKKFVFNHEERLGSVLCKGVKYKTSFMPSFSNRKQAEKNWQKYQQCHQYIKQEEQNNYHLIASTNAIDKAVSILRKGDVVYLEGFLVDVPTLKLKTGTRKKQFHKNIVVRGNAPGMCFILYVTKVVLNGRVFE